jgi:hypothetical protein
VLCVVYVSIVFTKKKRLVCCRSKAVGKVAWWGDPRHFSSDISMNRAHFLYVYSSIMSPATRHTGYIPLAFKSQPLLDLKYLHLILKYFKLFPSCRYSLKLYSTKNGYKMIAKRYQKTFPDS